MSIGCVINTSCLADGANTHQSSGGLGVPYARRAWLLRSVILPLYRWANLFSEIVVVGEFEAGEGYTYIPAPSIHHNCADALWKRQLGFQSLQHPTVEWVLFQHDDHLYDPLNGYPAKVAAEVLSPSRWTHARGPAEALNDGHHDGYVNGHACLMRPSVLREFNWSQIPPVHTWDLEVTARLSNLGVKWDYAPELHIWDMEEGGVPWL